MERKEAQKTGEIPWTQWITLSKAVEKKGIRCPEWETFSGSIPQIFAAEGELLLERELARLETVLLQKSIRRLQDSFRLCMEDGDLSVLERGIRDFKREIAACFYFNQLEGFPARVKKDIGSQVLETLQGFVGEFMGYVRKMDENGTNDFLDEVTYLCQKAKLKKYVGEFDVYG